MLRMLSPNVVSGRGTPLAVVLARPPICSEGEMRMTKWEYCSVVSGMDVTLTYFGQGGAKKMEYNARYIVANLGREGWELVSVVYDESKWEYFFKRPL